MVRASEALLRAALEDARGPSADAATQACEFLICVYGLRESPHRAGRSRTTWYVAAFSDGPVADSGVKFQGKNINAFLQKKYGAHESKL